MRATMNFVTAGSDGSVRFVIAGPAQTNARSSSSSRTGAKRRTRSASNARASLSIGSSAV